MKYLITLLICLLSFGCPQNSDPLDLNYYLKYEYSNIPGEEPTTYYHDQFNSTTMNVSSNTNIDSFYQVDPTTFDSTLIVVSQTIGAMTFSDSLGLTTFNVSRKWWGAVTFDEVKNAFSPGPGYHAVVSGSPAGQYHVGIKRPGAEEYNPSNDESAFVKFKEQGEVYIEGDEQCFDVLLEFDYNTDAPAPLDRHIFKGDANLKICYPN